MNSKIRWLLALPGRIFRSLGVITVSWEREPRAAAELCGDESQDLILAELRKQTTLLEVLAKQGDRAASVRSTACADLCSVIRPATGAAASGLPG